MVIFIGKVMARAIGSISPGLDLGTAIFIAAGTAIYEALAANMANINRLDSSLLTIALAIATKEPLINGTKSANKSGNQPKEKKYFSFLPLLIPISKRKIAKNPLNKSLVKGLMPSACLSLASIPITKLPKISITLPFVKECLIAILF